MRILIFSAHPDDAEFAMGGTLLLLAREHEVTICTITDGCAGTFGDAAAREQEAHAAAKFAGANLVWVGNKDCTIDYTREQSYAIASLIRQHKPDIVFTPGVTEGSFKTGRKHPDHVALGRCVRDAARFARFNIEGITGQKHAIQQLIFYMVEAHEATLAFSVDSVRDRMLALWQCHKSQMQLRENTIEKHLLEWRALNAEHYKGVELAETFRTDEPMLLSPQLFR